MRLCVLIILKGQEHMPLKKITKKNYRAQWPGACSGDVRSTNLNPFYLYIYPPPTVLPSIRGQNAKTFREICRKRFATFLSTHGVIILQAAMQPLGGENLHDTAS